MPVTSVVGAAFFGSTESRTTEHEREADLLGQIEAIGWHLEHASHVFVQTETESSKRPLMTGARVAVSGVLMGVYLFRNTDRGAEATQ